MRKAPLHLATNENVEEDDDDWSHKVPVTTIALTAFITATTG